MQWNSAAEFFNMGGYGFYVWWSFGVTAAFMIFEPIMASRRHKRAVQAAKVSQSWKEAN